jgi:hypothetical protein
MVTDNCLADSTQVYQPSLSISGPAAGCSDPISDSGFQENEYLQWLDPRLCISHAVNRDSSSSDNLVVGDSELFDTIVVQWPGSGCLSLELE